MENREDKIIKTHQNTFRAATRIKLHLVCRLRPYLTVPCLARVVNALVISHLDYCNVLYCGAAFEGDSETTTNPECG